MSKNQGSDEPHRPLPYTYKDKPRADELCLKRFLPTRPELPKASTAALRAANRLLHLVRENRWSIQPYCCHRCRQLPTNPVTGPCGHTFCMQCTVNARCQCGALAPANPRVNTLIRNLIEMLYRKWEQKNPVAPYSYVRRRLPKVTRVRQLETSATTLMENNQKMSEEDMLVDNIGDVSSLPVSPLHRISRVSAANIPLEPQKCIKLAGKLLMAGRFADAAPVLAVIAVGGNQAKAAKSILAKIITFESKRKEKRIPKIISHLYRAAALPTVQTWFTPGDLECVLCFNTYTNPVTTECGHMYCRGCVLRHSKQCPLCRQPLSKLELTIINETSFVNAGLSAVGELQQTDRFFIPVLFLSTVAYPMMPCPIYISDPMHSRYLPMINNVLEFGGRRFGVVSLKDDGSTANYGTIVEVRDCILFEDGRCILSTMGISRFKILEYSEAEGCDVVTIQTVTDSIPNYKVDGLIWYCHYVINAAKTWLNQLDSGRTNAIYHAYGKPPLDEYKLQLTEWNPDGPNLFWWYFSILPLGRDLKVLILSSNNMAQRAIAMRRVLDVLITDF